MQATFWKCMHPLGLWTLWTIPTIPCQASAITNHKSMIAELHCYQYRHRYGWYFALNYPAVCIGQTWHHYGSIFSSMSTWLLTGIFLFNDSSIDINKTGKQSYSRSILGMLLTSCKVGVGHSCSWRARLSLWWQGAASPWWTVCLQCI